MSQSRASQFLEAASAVLPGPEAALLASLHDFTARRLHAGAQATEELCSLARRAEDADAEAALHAGLREWWEALDGLAREVDLVMHHLAPDASLYPPLEMTRQCTFYTVRKRLHESPRTAEHPVSRFLWETTRDAPEEAYARLSFLYNLALFLPVSLVDGMLPGTDDLPEHARTLVKAANVARCPTEELQRVVAWVESFCEKCYDLLAQALAHPTR